MNMKVLRSALAGMLTLLAITAVPSQDSTENLLQNAGMLQGEISAANVEARTVTIMDVTVQMPEPPEPPTVGEATSLQLPPPEGEEPPPPPEGEEPPSLEDLVGHRARIGGQWDGDTLVARQVELREVGSREAVAGPITDSSVEGIIVIGAVPVLLPPPLEGGEVSSDSLGERLTAFAIGHWDGEVLVADRIEDGKEQEPPGADVRGEITEIDAENSLFIVGEVTLRILSTTQLCDELGRPLTFEDFEVGDFIRAHGEPNGDVIDAEKVRLDDMVDEERPRTQFRGPVIEVNGAAKAFVVDVPAHTFDIHLDRVRVQTNEYTRFDTPNHAFSDIEVDVIVGVEGIFVSGEGFLATKVKIEDRDDPHRGELFYQHGTIQAKYPHDLPHILVNDHPIYIREYTVIASLQGPLTFDDLRVGDVIHAITKPSEDIATVAIYPPPPAPLDALFIWVERGPRDHRRHVVGSITAIPSPEVIAINRHLVAITPSTEFVGYDGEAIAFESFDVGEPVLAVGPHRDGRPLIASRIQRTRALIQRVNVSREAIVVNRIPILVTDETEIVLPDGEPGSFADLHPCQPIHLLTDDEASIEATFIRVLGRLRHSDFGDDIAPLQVEIENGTVTVILSGEGAVGGAVYLDVEAADIHPSSIAVLEMDISSNHEDPALNPLFRVRLGSQNFQRTAYTAIRPVGTQTITASPVSKTYIALLTPPADAPEIASEEANGLYIAFDALDFDVTEPTVFTIHRVELLTIPTASVEVLEVLETFDFTDSTQGWLSDTSNAATFTPPVLTAEDSALKMHASDTKTYGSWVRVVNGLDLQPGSVLRMRATLNSPSEDSARLPRVRLRIHDLAFEQVATTVVQPNGPSDTLPNAENQTYDVIWKWPADAPAIDAVALDVDLVNFDRHESVGERIHIDNVVLEKVSLND